MTVAATSNNIHLDFTNVNHETKMEYPKNSPGQLKRPLTSGGRKLHSKSLRRRPDALGRADDAAPPRLRARLAAPYEAPGDDIILGVARSNSLGGWS